MKQAAPAPEASAKSEKSEETPKHEPKHDESKEKKEDKPYAVTPVEQVNPNNDKQTEMMV